MPLLNQLTTINEVDPPILVVYGKAGCGKTQFGIDMPNPIFAMFENGLGNRKASAIDMKTVVGEDNAKMQPYEALLSLVKELATTTHDYKTLVVDSVDHLNPFIDNYICTRDGKASIEAYGYGKGFDAEANEWLLLMNRLIKLRGMKKMNILLIAHAGERQINDPIHSDTYSVWEPKIPKKACAIVKELSDIVAYICPVIRIIENEAGKTKAVGRGDFVLKCNSSVAYEAKNRYNLKDDMPASAKQFMEAVGNSNLTPQQPS